jgi:hypothetical protein
VEHRWQFATGPKGFWPRHFELMTRTDKIADKESRGSCVHAAGTSSVFYSAGPGARRSQIRLLGLKQAAARSWDRLGCLERLDSPVGRSRKHHEGQPPIVPSRKSRSLEIGMLSWEEASKLSRSRDMHFPRRPLS